MPSAFNAVHLNIPCLRTGNGSTDRTEMGESVDKAEALTLFIPVELQSRGRETLKSEVSRKFHATVVGRGNAKEVQEMFTSDPYWR